jgi:preprotein translocase subunit SecG
MIVYPTILLSVILAIDMAVALFFLTLIQVHLGMGLSHISEQQFSILLRQGFNMSFQRYYVILVSTARGRKR